jgi:hypothetical protein
MKPLHIPECSQLPAKCTHFNVHLI